MLACVRTNPALTGLPAVPQMRCSYLDVKPSFLPPSAVPVTLHLLQRDRFSLF